jgi:hypothetical protein
MATIDRIRITSADIEKTAKGKVEDTKEIGALNCFTLDAHPNHWKLLTPNKNKEKALLDKMNVDDKRAVKK